MSVVFVSHASADRELVETSIVTLLTGHGLSLWYAREEITTGSIWERKIREGLESCDYFLVALTPQAVQSNWVRAETDWAIENRPERIVPVLLEPCNHSELHLRLRLIQFVDFVRRNAEQKARLLEVWGISYLDGDAPTGPAPASATDRELASQDGYLYARPKNWHCIICGWACDNDNNDYLCIKCNSVRPFVGGSATMIRCRECEGYSLGLAKYCEWCGAAFYHDRPAH